MSDPVGDTPLANADGGPGRNSSEWNHDNVPRLAPIMSFGFQGERDSLAFVTEEDVVYTQGRGVTMYRPGLQPPMLFSEPRTAVDSTVALAVSPDRRTVAVCERTNTGSAQVSLLDATTLRLEAVLTSDVNGCFASCAFSPDSSTLAAVGGGDPGWCVGWEVGGREDSAPSFAFQLDHQADQVSFGPSEAVEIVTTSPTTLRRWTRGQRPGNTDEPEPWHGAKVPGIGLDSRESSDSPYCITGHSWVGGRLAVGTSSGDRHTVLVVSEGPLVSEVPAPVPTACLAPLARGFLLGGDDAGVALFTEAGGGTDAGASYAQAALFAPPAGGRVCHVAISPAGRRAALVLAAGGGVLDLPLPEALGPDAAPPPPPAPLLPAAHAGAVTSLDHAAHHPLLASASRADGSVRLWSTRRLVLVASAVFPPGEGPVAVAVAPEGGSVAVGLPGRAAVLAVRGNALAEGPALAVEGAPLAGAYRLRFSPGGARIAAVTADHRVAVFELEGEGWACKAVLDAEPPGPVHGVEWGVDGGQLMARGEGGALCVWRAEGEGLSRITAEESEWAGVAGSYGAMAGAPGCEVGVSAARGVAVSARHGGGVQAVPLVGGGGPLPPVRPHPAGRAVTQLCLAPDGTSAFTADDAGLVVGLAVLGAGEAAADAAAALARGASVGRAAEEAAGPPEGGGGRGERLPPLEDAGRSASLPAGPHSPVSAERLRDVSFDPTRGIEPAPPPGEPPVRATPKSRGLAMPAVAEAAPESPPSTVCSGEAPKGVIPSGDDVLPRPLVNHVLPLPSVERMGGGEGPRGGAAPDAPDPSMAGAGGGGGGVGVSGAPAVVIPGTGGGLDVKSFCFDALDARGEADTPVPAGSSSASIERHMAELTADVMEVAGARDLGVPASRDDLDNPMSPPDSVRSITRMAGHTAGESSSAGKGELKPIFVRPGVSTGGETPDYAMVKEWTPGGGRSGGMLGAYSEVARGSSRQSMERAKDHMPQRAVDDMALDARSRRSASYPSPRASPTSKVMGSNSMAYNPRDSTGGRSPMRAGMASMYRQRSRDAEISDELRLSNELRLSRSNSGNNGSPLAVDVSPPSEVGGPRMSNASTLGKPQPLSPVVHARPTASAQKPVMVIPARQRGGERHLPTQEEIRTATAGLFQAAGGLVIDANKNARVSVVTRSETVKPYTFHDKARYRIDALIASGRATFYMLIVLVIVVVLVGATILYVARRLGAIDDDEAGDDEKGWGACIWETWTMVIDTGTHTVVEGSNLHRALATCFTLVGVMFFIVITGLVVDSIRAKLAALEKGRSRVVEEGHFLVLGWNDKVAPLMRQLAISMISEGGGVIVVMADRDKVVIEEDLSHVWEGVRVEIPTEFRRKLRVVVRSGSPQNSLDLLMVSAPTARSIVLLSETGSADKSDSKLMRCVLSLSGLPGGLRGHVVAELRDVDNLPLMELVGGDNVEPVTSHDIIGRMMMKSARQVGLTSVFEKMIGFEGHEFYLKQWPELDGQKFKDILWRFHDAVPLGVKMAKRGKNGSNPLSGGNIVLCPDDDYVMAPGDELLVLAEDDDTYKPTDDVIIEMDDVDPPEFAPDPPATVERVLMCGWRRDMQDLLALCDEYCAQGSEVHILNDLSLEEREKQMMEGGLDVEGLFNITMVHHFGNPSVRRNLELLPLSSFTYVLVLAEQTLEEDVLDSDSQMLATLLLVRDIQQRWSRMEVRHRRLAVMKNSKHIDRCHAIEHAVEEFMHNTSSSAVDKSRKISCKTICEVLDSRTREMIVRNRSIAEMADYVESPALISRILAMIAVRRETRLVLEELLGPYGPSVVICPAKLYLREEGGGEHEELNFWEMAVRVRMMGRILLGFTDTPEMARKKGGVSSGLSKKFSRTRSVQERFGVAGGKRAGQVRSPTSYKRLLGGQTSSKEGWAAGLKKAWKKRVAPDIKEEIDKAPPPVEDYRIASRTVLNPSDKDVKRSWLGQDLVVLCPPLR